MPVDNYEYRGSPITKRDLNALEKKLGVHLSDDYRAFLLRVDGGHPCPDDIFNSGRRDRSQINILYSVRHEDEECTIERLHMIFRDRIPKGLLPIGDDPGGSQICLGIGEDNRGKVFFWDMEDERDQPTYENVRLIADSFAEFLDSLYSDEDD